MQRSVLVVIALLAVPVVQAGPWTQAGYDAARTGNVPGPGPATNDTAFRTRLPGTPPAGLTSTPHEPLIIDGQAYVPVTPSSVDEELDALGIARVNLSTGEMELHVPMDRAPQTLAIADGRLFVSRDRGVDAYDLETGERLWSMDHPVMVAEHAFTFCMAPAVRDGSVVFPCTEVDVAGGASSNGNPRRTVPFLWKLDAATGDQDWLRRLDRGTEAQDSPTPGQDDAYAPLTRFVAGVSLVGPRAFALTGDLYNDDTPDAPDQAGAYAYVEQDRFTLWAIDAETTEILWTNSTTPVNRATVRAWAPGIYESESVRDPLLPLAPRVTGTSQVIYAKIQGEVRAINPAREQLIWDESLGSKDTETSLGGTHSAFTGNTLFSASTQSLYRFDLDGPVRRWVFSLDPGLDEQFSWGTLIAGEDTLYARTVNWDDYSALYAVDAGDGTRTWRRVLRPAPGWDDAGFSYSLGEGVLAVAGTDGTFRAIGRTGASLGQPAVEASTAYPDVGETVELDVADIAPGAFGPATKYRVFWGDGNVSGWQNGTTFTHAYDEAGNHTARIQAANAANQTASTTHTFHVGQEPPQEPTLLQQAFAPKNQDLTFGVIGIALAVGGGLVGVTRRYRKRSKLQDELATLEEGFSETRGNPGECEAFLDTRKARARSLLMDGDLTEEQFGVVERRVDELRRELRTGVLDTRLQFLPHGMVESLKTMLADGKISTWERDTIEDLLEDDDTLNEAQRERVRAMLERWSEDQSGGGPA